jgi:uncharacterized protein with NRDE domain
MYTGWKNLLVTIFIAKQTNNYCARQRVVNIIERQSQRDFMEEIMSEPGLESWVVI